MKKLRILILLVGMGCTSKPSAPPITIGLINNNQSLKISGLDNLIISDISRDTANHFENLVPVYRMPADTDMKDFQPAQPGEYIVKDGALVFTPDTPFTKQRAYFVRYYKYGEENSVWDFAKHNKTATKLRYMDLNFRVK